MSPATPSALPPDVKPPFPAMKSLPTTYRKNGFTYTLLESNGACALYAQDLDDQRVGYEVCHIIHRPESSRMMGGTLVTTEAGEYLPSTEQWGTKAWTLRKLETAGRRFFDETARVLAAREQAVPA